MEEIYNRVWYIRECVSSIVYTEGESLQNYLRDVNLWNDLGFSLCTALSVYYVVAISEERRKSEMGVSVDWYVTVEH